MEIQYIPSHYVLDSIDKIKFLLVLDFWAPVVVTAVGTLLLKTGVVASVKILCALLQIQSEIEVGFDIQ